MRKFRFLVRTRKFRFLVRTRAEHIPLVFAADIMDALERSNLFCATTILLIFWLLQLFGDQTYWVPSVYFIRVYVSIYISDGHSGYDSSVQQWIILSNVIGAVTALYFLFLGDKLGTLDVITFTLVVIDAVLYSAWFFYEFRVLGWSGVGAQELFDASTLRSVTEQDMDPEPTCAICHDEYDSEVDPLEPWCKMPRCSHIFHRNCVLPWLNQNQACPQCRQRQTGEWNMEM